MKNLNETYFSNLNHEIMKRNKKKLGFVKKRRDFFLIKIIYYLKVASKYSKYGNISKNTARNNCSDSVSKGKKRRKEMDKFRDK